MSWANGRNGTILVTHGKTDSARQVLPLTLRPRNIPRNILRDRWQEMERPAEGRVWSADTRSEHFEKSTLKKQHKKALTLSRVRPFVLYSLRHTFLTRLGESGCDAWTLAGIAGHSSIAMSARYVHTPAKTRHNFGHSTNLNANRPHRETASIFLKRLR